MASSTNKKVVVYRFDRPSIAGYLDHLGESGSGLMALLTPQGELHEIALNEVKAVCFVRDLDGSEPWGEQRVFRSRPKTEGLWVQLEFLDGDIVQGVVPNNLLQMEASGVSYTPPDPAANNQRIFAPRQALLSAKVLGVIGGQTRGRKKPEEEKRQIGLFE